MPFFAAVAAVAAVVTVALTVYGLRLQYQTAKLTREGLVAARATMHDTELARLAAEETRLEYERDGKRLRLERIADLVEDVFWASARDERYPDDRPTDPLWQESRNRLRHALGGRGHELPKCQLVVRAGSFQQAHAFASVAREELGAAITVVDTQ